MSEFRNGSATGLHAYCLQMCRLCMYPHVMTPQPPLPSLDLNPSAKPLKTLPTSVSLLVLYSSLFIYILCSAFCADSHYTPSNDVASAKQRGRWSRRRAPQKRQANRTPSWLRGSSPKGGLYIRLRPPHHRCPLGPLVIWSSLWSSPQGQVIPLIRRSISCSGIKVF